MTKQECKRSVIVGLDRQGNTPKQISDALSYEYKISVKEIEKIITDYKNRIGETELFNDNRITHPQY